MDHTESNFEVYAQLSPDTGGRQQLQALQASLPNQAKERAVDAHSLHLTLLHYVKAADVYTTISSYSSITYQNYANLLREFANNMRSYMPAAPVVLQPVGFARLGLMGGTLVLEYAATPSMLVTHEKIAASLKAFFHDCGVQGVDTFMANDRNFKYASELRPHITLYKGY